MRTSINGITLAYNDIGRGLPLVFLHAFPLNRTMWAPQEEALSRKFRFITIDLRGHGESDAPLWRYTLDQFADDVRGLLDHLAIPQAVLVGLSMGGYLIFSCYRRFPERIKALVLADTRAEADKPEVLSWRFELAQRVYRQGPSAVADEMGPKLLSPTTIATRPDLVERVRKIILSTQVSGIVGDLMAIAERPDSTGLLPGITCPTLVVVGDRDVLTTPDENERIAKAVPGGKFEIIPEAGHLSNLDQPELFNQAVEKFLLRIVHEGS
jgi:pimeloyl-ACP methyl ester carboxylesterase